MRLAFLLLTLEKAMRMIMLQERASGLVYLEPEARMVRWGG